jgi:hypothetical protein
MKTILKIAIALVVLTAIFNAGRASFNNYSFEDAVHEGLLFDPNASDAEITDMIMKLAREYDVPLETGNIQIQSKGQDLVVQMSYNQSVVLVPGVFQRDWTFEPSTSTRLLGKAKGGRR